MLEPWQIKMLEETVYMNGDLNDVVAREYIKMLLDERRDMAVQISSLRDVRDTAIEMHELAEDRAIAAEDANVEKGE